MTRTDSYAAVRRRPGHLVAVAVTAADTANDEDATLSIFG